MLLLGPRHGEHLRGRIEGVRQLVEREGDLATWTSSLSVLIQLSVIEHTPAPKKTNLIYEIMRQLPRYVSNDDTISDWSLSSKMAKIPTLERLYECGEVLANAKGLTHKVFTFTEVQSLNPLSCSRFTFMFPGSQGGVWGDPTWCSRRWSVQEAQFAVHWKVELSFHLRFWKTASEYGDDLFFFLLLRFFPHFPDLCQQSIDAMLDLCEDVNTMIRMQVPFFFISLLFSWNCINICRRSKTCPTSAATPRSRLFPRSPTFSPNSSRWTFPPCRLNILLYT